MGAGAAPRRYRRPILAEQLRLHLVVREARQPLERFVSTRGSGAVARFVPPPDADVSVDPGVWMFDPPALPAGYDPEGVTDECSSSSTYRARVGR